jgi:hypothetical protein
MSNKKETWGEYFMENTPKPLANRAKFWRDNIVKGALMAGKYLSEEQIKEGLLAALRAVDGYSTGQPVADAYLGSDYIEYDIVVKPIMSRYKILHPEATDEEIKQLFPNPLGEMKKHKRKKRKSKPSNMTTSKSSTSKSSKNKKGEKKKKKGKRTKNRRNNYTKRMGRTFIKKSMGRSRRSLRRMRGGTDTTEGVHDRIISSKQNNSIFVEMEEMLLKNFNEKRINEEEYQNHLAELSAIPEKNLLDSRLTFNDMNYKKYPYNSKHVTTLQKQERKPVDVENKSLNDLLKIKEALDEWAKHHGPGEGMVADMKYLELSILLLKNYINIKSTGSDLIYADATDYNIEVLIRVYNKYCEDNL